MAEAIQVGDRVQVFLKSDFWRSEGWFDGTVIRIDPYTQHRSFIWVKLDEDATAKAEGAAQVISVLNPRNIRKA